MKSFVSLLVYLAVSLLVWGQTPPNPPDTIILRHVTVIDSTSSAPKPNVSVLIEGDKIKAIFSARNRNVVMPQAVTVEARGKFLIAGLWDMHVHALNKSNPDRFFPLFIANGVTGVRDMGGDIPLSAISRLKEAIHNGSRLGPEIFAPGPILEGEHPFWPFSISVRGPDDARRAVSTLTTENADFLKVYNTLSREAYLAIASEAKAARVPFVGHIPDTITPAEAARVGQKSIEHLWGIPNYLSSRSEQLQKMAAEASDAEDPKVARDLFYKINETILATYDSGKAKELFQELIRNRTWQCPTLVVLRSYASIHDSALRNDSHNAYMPDDLLKLWSSMGGPSDSRNDEIQMRLFRRNIEIVKFMHDAGVSVLAGTDTPNPYTYPGFSLHEELQLLVAAGFSPMQALRTATIDAAEFLGVGNAYGSIEVGKVANLVLLDANPLEDIRNTRKIRAVLLRGKFLDREKLDSLLEGQRRDAVALSHQ